jgi:hypothetical protein
MGTIYRDAVAACLKNNIKDRGGDEQQGSEDEAIVKKINFEKKVVEPLSRLARAFS